MTARIQRNGKVHAVFHTRRRGSYRVQASFKGDSEYGIAYSPHCGKFTVRWSCARFTPAPLDSVDGAAAAARGPSPPLAA